MDTHVAHEAMSSPQQAKLRYHAVSYERIFLTARHQKVTYVDVREEPRDPR